jgi:hypothetical protein
VLLLSCTAGAADAADLKKIDRQIKKEPAYQSKSPQYALLVFGPEAKDRAWLVRDGDVLYVDRNGDGDLTAPGNKVLAKKDQPRDEDVTFEAGELKLNGKKHTHLKVSFSPLKSWMYGANTKHPDLVAALKADPAAQVMSLMIDVEAPQLRAKGRVTQIAGPLDRTGALLTARKPTDAPVVHLGGPVLVTFYGSLPTLRRGKSSEFTLIVGTPGLGGGTFANVVYDETIPAAANPAADVTFPAEKEGGEPVKKRFEFKERC